MTPNRYDGRDSAHWWADLPPKIRARFTPAMELPEDNPVTPSPPEHLVTRLVAQFGTIVLFVALANVVLLLLALIIFVSQADLPTTNP